MDEHIKPFNFYPVGYKMQNENGVFVKPISPFSKDQQTIVFREFIDYQTGEMKQGSYYIKPLNYTILNMPVIWNTGLKWSRVSGEVAPHGQ